MKGIILAGGTGYRLLPLTKLINKHLLPVYNLPMVMFPLNTLIDAGIKDIIIISGREHAGQFLQMLGSGKEIGISLTYAVQEKSGGIAEALRLCKNFVNGKNAAVILGDNIFENKFDFNDFREGAKIFLKEVHDSQRFGVAKIDNEKIISIEEKPKIPPSNLAVTGLYLYDDKVFDIIDRLKPSGRGELEITDVNNAYLEDGKIDYDIIDGFWGDAGTMESLYSASTFVRNRTIKNNDK